MVKILHDLKFVLSGLVITLTIFSCQMPRVVQRSSKEKPEWIYGIQSGSIIVEGIGDTHEKAQEDAMRKVREKIVSSVAVNIFSETNMQISEQIINEMSRYAQSTDVSTKIVTDFFNSLRGISISKVSEYYWEKKKYPYGTFKIHYHLIYPFPNSELEKLINEWEKTDRAFTDELNAIENELSETEDIFAISSIKRKAEALSNIFTGTRKTKAKIIAENATNYLEDIRFEVLTNERGHLILALISQNKVLKINQDFRFESNCATLIKKQILKDQKQLEIFYDVDYCKNNENEFIYIAQTILNKTISIKLNIPDDENTIRLFVNEPLRVRQWTDLFQKFSEWFIPLRVISKNSFTIKKIELVVLRDSKISLRKFVGADKKQQYLIFEEDVLIEGKGDQTISFRVAEYQDPFFGLFKSLVDETSMFFVSGKIYYIPQNEQNVKTFEFENLRLIRIN
ncbi:MAG TPA: hypothetical protein P5538_07200 [Bacteroidales bacterium]|nr:hypothetical protein [Bacteroidales bacterium]HPD23156.1 hypothetical protein [Bacteroidales bacterium]HRS99085.1 hypothetical protein [Bacteroidales bacterium]HRT80706.1 hypothetical protein [Bacteroidales bacterium]